MRGRHTARSAAGVDAREAYAVVEGLLAALMAFRQGPGPSTRRPTPAEEEDPLFIG